MKNKIAWRIAIVALTMLLLGTLGYSSWIQQSVKKENAQVKIYSAHYAFISDMSYSGEVWQELYQGAKSYGEEHDILVEWFGKNLVESYSKAELMEMAIQSGVDGIIVQGDDSSEMNNLVNRADSMGIPVVNIGQDCYGSYRKSFVGVSSINLGQTYGKYLVQILDDDDDSLLVIINTGKDDSGEKLMYSGIRETLSTVMAEDCTVETMIVDGSENYGIEESIRNLLIQDELPSVIVCLDEQTTSTMIRLMVDYNKVGYSKVVGFYDSPSILQAISGNVITATITNDCTAMGAKAVEVLLEYMEHGYVSEYVPVDVEIINAANVADYLNREEDNADD